MINHSVFEIENSKRLFDWQKKNIVDLLNLINKSFDSPKKIRILDIGCSVEELNIMSHYVKSIVGINTYFPKNPQNITLNSNVTVLKMDGTDLKFLSNEFDFVYSLNVFEHIQNLSKAIDEKLRVTKRNGYCYAKWYPIWSGPRGHHVHDDVSMVKTWEKETNCKKSIYKNNGFFIPDWSHLLLDKKEMSEKLLPKLKNKKLVEKIVDYIYENNDINRIFFDEVIKVINNKKIKIIFLNKNTIKEPNNEIRKKLIKRYNYSDFSTIECETLFQKK